MEIYAKRPEVVGGVTMLYAKIIFPVRKASAGRAP